MYTLREEEGLRRLQPLIAAVQAAGGHVLSASGWSLRVRAEVPTAAVLQFAGMVGIQHVGRWAPEDAVLDWGTDCGTTSFDNGYTINGVEMQRLDQTTQFYAAGYHGEGYRIAFAEGQAHQHFKGHVGFDNGSGNNRSFACSILPYSPYLCMDTNNFTARLPDDARNHATGVASILVGDLTRGQDPDYAAGSVGAVQRSGVARRASLYGVGFSDAYWEQFVISPTNNISVLSMSGSPASDSTTLCTGADTIDQEGNDIFEAGIAYVKSAGNGGNANQSDCRVGYPGSAMGVFPIAVYTWLRDSDGAKCELGDTDCTKLKIGVASSRGGTPAEGRGRTIIGLAAPEGFQYSYPHYVQPNDYATGDPTNYRSDWDSDTLVGDPNSNGKIWRADYGTMTQTSAATPQVAGLAVLFRDWYESEVSSDISDPGLLYANLLLMGDRHQEGGGSRTTEYDGLWGAGKLRARMFNAAGLDNPSGGGAWWGDGSICVDDATEVLLPIFPDVNGDPTVLASGTAYVRVALWFYDSTFDDDPTTLINDVGATMERGQGSWTALFSTDRDDNRRLLFSGDLVSGYKYRVRLTGHTVFEDAAGCGINSMRVYWAALAEGNGREQGDTPECVAPENL